MYEIAVILLIAPLVAILMGLYVGGIETVIQVWDEWQERRQKIKKLDRDIKALTKIAQEKDNITDAVEKGYAVARLLNKAYERKCIKENGGKM